MGKTIPGMSIPTGWLHWITKQNKTTVTTVDFLTEARSLGILVPISLSALSLMSWGDEVYCIHKQKKQIRGSVFCKFPITLVSGLTDEAMEAVVERLKVKEIKAEGGFVERLLGDYVELGTWTVNATMQDIHQVLKKLKNETAIGTLAVGCYPSEFSALEVPWARLAQVNYSPGFRQFNGDQFTEDAEGYKNTNTYQATFKVSLDSTYDSTKNITRSISGNVQAVNRYTELDHAVGQMELLGI